MSRKDDDDCDEKPFWRDWVEIAMAIFAISMVLAYFYSKYQEYPQLREIDHHYYQVSPDGTVFKHHENCPRCKPPIEKP